MGTSWLGADPSPLRHWLVVFCVPAVLFLPATVAMGGTLPAMDRLVAQLAAHGRSIGGLYAANTLGAVAGTLLATYVLVPKLGYGASHLVLAAINLVCGLAVWRIGSAQAKRVGPAWANAASGGADTSNEGLDLKSRHRLAMTLLVTGLLGIGYEVLVVRVLEQVLENTVYTFASALSVYLLGTAMGAAIYQKWLARQPFAPCLARLLQVLSAACAAGILLLWRAPAIYYNTRSAFGGGFGGSVLAEMVLAAVVFGLPTTVMGALFSHLVQAARHGGGGVGWAMGINTIGSALAPVVFGVLLLPQLGAKTAFLVLIGGYLLLGPPMVWRSHLGALPALALGLWILSGPGAKALASLPASGHLVEFQEGPMATVMVQGDDRGNRWLVINSFQMGGTRSRFPDLRQGHLPLLLHPAPQRALYLGLGAGITFQAAGFHTNLLADGVELVPEVLPLLRHFEVVPGQLFQQKNLAIHVGDARRFVRTTREQYDVVVGDLFHPARDGAGALYTVEHFAAIRDRLQPGGLFCQWLPLYQLDLDMLQLISRTFMAVFPDAAMLLCHNSVDSPIVGLVGFRDRPQYGLGWMSQRIADPRCWQNLQQVNLAEDLTVFGNLLATQRELAAFCGRGPLNTDDRPLVVFDAPRFTYGPPTPPRLRLMSLLQTLGPPDPDGLFAHQVGPSDTARLEGRLRRYWSARLSFLRALAADGPGERSRLLWESLHASQDFADAYMFLLYQVAPGLFQNDPAAARRLLQELQAAHPHRAQARELQQRLLGNG